MTTAAPPKPRTYRPITTSQLREELETAREDLAVAQAELNGVLTRFHALTTLVWECTQPDAAPTYSPSFRRRSA